MTTTTIPNPDRQVMLDYSCPFCYLKCASFKGLKCHLQASHYLSDYDIQNEPDGEGSPRYQGHTLAKEPVAKGLQTTVITDSVVFAMISYVNMVIVWAHAVMANDGVIVPIGLNMVAQAAKRPVVPFAVLAGIHNEEASRIAENVTLSHTQKTKINVPKYSAMMAPIVVILERRLASTSRKPDIPHEIWFHNEYMGHIKATNFKNPASSATTLGDI
ncbi:translation initiation factor eIF-2B subunit beta-like protein [Tanacetum coccineum]